MPDLLFSEFLFGFVAATVSEEVYKPVVLPNVNPPIHQDNIPNMALHLKFKVQVLDSFSNQTCFINKLEKKSAS